MVRDRLGVVVLATAAALVLSLPTAAGAAIQVDSLTVTPSTTAAGANPDVTVDEHFSYGPSTTDSVKKTVLHFPAGLLGNPQATPKCSEAEFQLDTCPADTQVGETTVGTLVYAVPGVGVPVTASGSIYNLVPEDRKSVV